MANISDLLLKNKIHAKIFNHATAIGKELNTPIYIVGGYVRDLILGKGLKDIDLMVENNSSVFAERLAKKLNVKKVVKPPKTPMATNSFKSKVEYFSNPSPTKIPRRVQPIKLTEKVPTGKPNRLN